MNIPTLIRSDCCADDRRGGLRPDLGGALVPSLSWQARRQLPETAKASGACPTPFAMIDSSLTSPGAMPCPLPIKSTRTRKRSH